MSERSSLPKPLRVVLTGAAFAIFIGGSGVISWALIPLKRRRIRELDAKAQRREWDLFFQDCYGWSVKMMSRLGLMDFEVPPLPKDFPHGKPFVLIANHPSLIDILFLKAAVPGLTCLVKAALFRQPQLRPILELSGDFAGPDAAQQEIGSTAVLDTFVERLEAGFPVTVFPEGTRSPKWGLRRFRRGAIEAACRAGVPVVPAFIWCDPPTLMKGQKWYEVPDRRAHFEIEYMPVIDTAGRDSHELTRTLKKEYERRVREAVARSDRSSARDAAADDLGAVPES
jgi:1-acyl-sn-glycerol-3-phosphate acyltransferase